MTENIELSTWRSLCVRVQSGRGDFIWLHVVMRVCDVTGTDDVTARRIVCINQLIDENEARVIRASDDVSRTPDIGILRGPHRGFLDGLFDEVKYSAGTKRGVTATAENWAAVGCSPAKIARQTDGVFDDPCLMSMPSPPLSCYGGNLAGQELPMGCGSSGVMIPMTSCPADGFEGPATDAAFIPESFLTPNASPCSYTSSPTPVYHPILLSDQQDWNTEVSGPNAEDLSFFDHAGLRDQTIKPGVLIHQGKLPELDLPTVTSYLDILEQADPLIQMAPVQGQGRAPPTSAVEGGAGGVVMQQMTSSTLDEELVENLFSTANSFLSSLTAVKPFEFSGCELLYAH